VLKIGQQALEIDFQAALNKAGLPSIKRSKRSRR
jgi:hypothetical protein